MRSTKIKKTFAVPVYGHVYINTEQSSNAVSMAGQRLKRWANIETVLGE